MECIKEGPLVGGMFQQQEAEEEVLPVFLSCLLITGLRHMSLLPQLEVAIVLAVVAVAAVLELSKMMLPFWMVREEESSSSSMFLSLCLWLYLFLRFRVLMRHPKHIHTPETLGDFYSSIFFAANHNSENVREVLQFYLSHLLLLQNKTLCFILHWDY
jgi:hypothetical protein